MKEINRISNKGYDNIGHTLCELLYCWDCPVRCVKECSDALDAYIKANGLTIHIQPEKEQS